MSEPKAQPPAQEPDGDRGPDEDDVEGHNLMTGELARTVEREHRAEADRAVTSGTRSRQLKKKGPSLRDRLFGR